MTKRANRLTHLLLSACSLVLLASGWQPAWAADSRPVSERPSTPSEQSTPAVVDVRVSRDRYLAHSEPALAENPRNRNNLIAGSKLFDDPPHYHFQIGTFYSMDGGRTWHDSGRLPGFGDYTLTSDVSIGFAPDGTAYVAVLACDGGGVCPGDGHRSGVFVSRSTDGGKTFSAPVQVFLDTSGQTFSDKAWIAVDQTKGPTAGTIYVAWNLDDTGSARDVDAPDERFMNALTSDAPQAGIVVSRSTDSGRSFSTPVLVAKFDPQFLIGAVPAVGPDGHVHVVFASIHDTSDRVDGIEMAASTDGGLTFGEPQLIQHVEGVPNHLKNGTFRNVTLPAFAISPADGSMMITWADMRNGDADILASSSLDGGETWSKPVRINDDPTHNGKDQFQPALAVAPDGTYTCSWFDRRYDPGNHLIDEEIAQSTDDGRSFGRNIRVTHKSWDPAIGAPRPEGKKSNTFIGDYQALAADNRAVHPLWNDTQNGRSQEIRTAVMPVRVFFRH